MIISETIRRARKPRRRMAYEWLDNCLESTDGLTFAEKRSLVLANRCYGRIQPADMYLVQVIRDEDNELYRFWAKPELHEICLKLDLYDI